MAEATEHQVYGTRERMAFLLGARWVSPRMSFRLFLVMATLIVLANWPVNGLRLATDDYLIANVMAGSPVLPASSVTAESPVPASAPWLNAFHFFSESSGSLQRYRDYGNLAWWTSQEGLMNPLRPVAALTHWLDFKVFKADQVLVQLQSLVFLLFFWLSALILYRKITGPGTALLAAGFLVFDHSVSANLDWLAARNSYMAVACGMWVIWGHLTWRQEGRWSAGFLALLMYMVALLTAEASIATLGYVLAYALFMDNKGWFKGGLALLPYLVITVCWRVWYSQHGYGAAHIDLYADPGRGLGQFLEQLMLVYPCIITSLFIGVDGFITLLRHDAQLYGVLAAWGVTLVLALWLRSMLRLSPVARFMLAGAAMAAVPHASLLSAGSRSGTFVAIGFFFILAKWVVVMASAPTASKKVQWFAVLVVAWHLLFPIGAAFARNYALTPPPQDHDGFYENLRSAGHHAQRSVVVVNSPWAPQLFYLPFEAAYQGVALPASVNALSPGFTHLRLQRISELSFTLESRGVMGVDIAAPIGTAGGERSPLVDPAYVKLMTQGLLTDRRQVYHTEDRFQAGQIAITVLQVEQGRPRKIRVDFVGAERPEQMVWQWYDWSQKVYRTMTVPEVGESREFAGPFDQKG